MEVLTREQGGVTVLQLVGKMTEQVDSERLKDAVSTLIGQGKRSFVIDMHDVDYLGSAGIAALVCALDKVCKCDGSLRLASLQSHPQKVLALTRLDRLFDICRPGEDILSGMPAMPVTAAAVKDVPAWSARTLIEFPSTEGNITEAARRFGAFLDGLQLDQNMRFDLLVAFYEALANAVEHGNKADPSKCVVAECAANDRAVCVTVSDEGEGFDPDAIVTLASDPFRERGRGLLLIRSLMDQVSYNDKGNTITMLKHRSMAPSAEQQGRQEHDRVL